MADPKKLLAELLEFDAWLNAPPSREVLEPPEAHAYRFDAYRRWEKIGPSLAAILRSLAEIQPEQPQSEQPQDHLAAHQTSDVRGDTGREPEAFEAGTVAEWREATMADLMGLADEYAYRASLADADPDAGGCGPIASELAEQAARDELEDAMRIALSDRAAPLGLSS